MSTSAPKRTVFCPTGCHEDYMEREPITDFRDDKYYGSRYTCYRCGWVARWDNQGGFEVLDMWMRMHLTSIAMTSNGGRRFRCLTI